MSDDNLKILNAIPLVEVMRGWGYVPKRETRNGSTASYLCPWHDDHHPSLVVDKQLRDGASDLGFKCFACGQEGYGAIQLAARLMGLPAGKVPAEDLPEVLNELMTRCDVELKPETVEDGKRGYGSLRVNIVGWDEFHEAEKQYADWTGESPVLERGEWTEEHLKALGLKVDLATRKARKSDVTDEEIKIGDIITEFDENDTLQPLYRCSFGRDFYRGPKAETRTIKAWGEEVERVFGVEPLSRFIQRVTPEKGGAVARVVRATKNYPMFIFRYPWGIKKYEPRDTYGNKWTWWHKT